MRRRLRLAMGLLLLWPVVAGCGGSAIVESGNQTEGSGGTAGSMPTGGAGGAGAGRSAATGGLAEPAAVSPQAPAGPAVKRSAPM